MSKKIVAFRSREQNVDETQKQIDESQRELLLAYLDALRTRVADGEVIGLQTIEFGQNPDDWLSQIFVHPSLPVTAVVGALNMAVVESTDMVLYGVEEDEDEGARD